MRTADTQQTQKQLEFVHIPKTGGTAIEYAASLANITWGVCHWNAHKFAGPECHQTDLEHYDARQNLARHHKNNSNNNYNNIRWEHWHVPPRYQMGLADSPYRNKALFAVVRNPYERFISDFYCPYWGWNPVDWEREDRVVLADPMEPPLPVQARKKQNNTTPNGITGADRKPENAHTLNRFILQRLKQIHKATAHYLPQSDFIYDLDGVRIVEHVLKYEQLPEQFHNLMAMYSLPIYLNTTVNQRKHHRTHKRLTVADLFPGSIQRINQVFAQDFINFGYTMIR